MERSLRDEVWRRAGGNCQYCQMSSARDLLPFQIDHIIARQHRGSTTLDNLALICLPCNNHKGPNIAGIEWTGGVNQIVRLFHPVQDNWHEHFSWNGPLLEGSTPIGRTTVYVLAINLSYRVALRQELIDDGLFPLHR